MIDRQKLETILCRRFPGARFEQVAAAANAIIGLADGWEEVQEPDLRRLEREQEGGVELRLFRRVAVRR